MTTPTTTPGAAAEQKALSTQSKNRLTLRGLFDQQKPELAKLLPRGMDADRLYRMALTECVRNPELLECTAESWALAMQQCAAQGLFPDSALGFMYLIPRKNTDKRCKEVQAQRGYQGDMKLARNTGEVNIYPPEVVYTKDHYKVTRGTDPKIEHEPYEGDDDPGPLRAVYAVARLRATGDLIWVALTKRDVMRHKASSQSTGSNSPWTKHEAAMWKKTAIHELFHWLPKDTEAMERAAVAITRDAAPGVVETTAVDLGGVGLPAAGETGGGSSLDRMAAEIEGQGGAGAAEDPPPPAKVGDPDPKKCQHPDVPAPDSIPAGQIVVCKACGMDFHGGPPPSEAEARAAVEKLADRAGDTTKAPAKPRQGRLDG